MNQCTVCKYEQATVPIPDEHPHFTGYACRLCFMERIALPRVICSSCGEIVVPGDAGPFDPEIVTTTCDDCQAVARVIAWALDDLGYGPRREHNVYHYPTYSSLEHHELTDRQRREAYENYHQHIEDLAFDRMTIDRG